MKLACALLATLAVLASGSALAQQNDASFNESQGADGLFHIDIGVSYNFPGQGARSNNYGLGTVRVTLPDADLQLDPAQPPDAAYTCTAVPPSAVQCSTDGSSNGSGLTFPNSIVLHLIAQSCFGGTGTADVWSAPYDQGSPDVSIPIQAGECAAGNTPQQPVLDTKGLKCLVPKLKNTSLASATRRLANAKCARGTVRYAASATVKKGHVISQSKPPGTVLKEHGRVNLVVSRGKGK